MSFSSEVKRELLALDGQFVHCQAAELAAMLSGAGKLHQLGEPASCGRVFAADGRTHVTLTAENEQVVHRYARLLEQAAGIVPSVAQAGSMQQKNKILYQSDISKEEDVRKLLVLLNCMDEHGGIRTWADAVDILLKKTCCKRAFLRGAFLISGSMSNPKKSYHFEIVCADRARALQIQEQFGSFGLDAKTVTRKNHEVVYLKEGAQIVDALNIIGAHAALMNLENVRIIKEMRNDINRRVNCETANINKTVNAAYRQQEAIRFLQQKGFFEQLPGQLKEIARLRMEYPEAAIKELGTLCQPPVGKSGVNHRLRKLEEIAGQQGYEKKE